MQSHLKISVSHGLSKQFQHEPTSYRNNSVFVFYKVHAIIIWNLSIPPHQYNPKHAYDCRYLLNVYSNKSRQRRIDFANRPRSRSIVWLPSKWWHLGDAKVVRSNIVVNRTARCAGGVRRVVAVLWLIDPCEIRPSTILFTTSAVLLHIRITHPCWPCNCQRYHWMSTFIESQFGCDILVLKKFNNGQLVYLKCIEPSGLSIFLCIFNYNFYLYIFLF